MRSRAALALCLGLTACYNQSTTVWLRDPGAVVLSAATPSGEVPLAISDARIREVPASTPPFTGTVAPARLVQSLDHLDLVVDTPRGVLSRTIMDADGRLGLADTRVTTDGSGFPVANDSYELGDDELRVTFDQSWCSGDRGCKPASSLELHLRVKRSDVAAIREVSRPADGSAGWLLVPAGIGLGALGGWVTTLHGSPVESAVLGGFLIGSGALYVGFALFDWLAPTRVRWPIRDATPR